MIISDGKKTVCITIQVQNGVWGADEISHEFFCAEKLEFNDATGVYRVADVDDCLRHAEDYKYGRGDYFRPGIEIDPELTEVTVKETSILRELRNKRFWSRERLGREAGVNPRQIQRIENGESLITNMTFGNVVKLADALGVDPRDFL